MSELKPDSTTEFQDRVFHSQLLTGKIFVVDCGCPYDGEEESALGADLEVALTCAMEFGSELARHGAKVIYTRSRLAEVSIQERIIAANKYPQATALISWWNSGSGTQGFGVKVRKDEGTAGLLAKAIVQGMEILGVEIQDSGIVEATGVRILHRAVMPALLTEINTSTCKQNSGLVQGDWKKLVQTHVQALLKVFKESIVTAPGYTYRKMRFAATDVHLVVLKCPQIIVVTAPHGVLETTSKLAATHYGRVAISGGYFQGTQPAAPVIVNHKQVDFGIELPVDRAALGVLDDGSLEIIQARTAQDLTNFQYALSAGPQLVCGGKIQVGDEQFPVEITTGAAPRAAVGLVDKHTLLLTVVDGRSRQDRGLTLAETGAFLVARGALSAMNLAGGGYTTLVVGGQVKNDPSDGKELPVANALVII